MIESNSGSCAGVAQCGGGEVTRYLVGLGPVSMSANLPVERRWALQKP